MGGTYLTTMADRIDALQPPANPPAERSAEPEFETVPDNGTPHEVLSYLLDCAKRWVPEARIVGNARAGRNGRGHLDPSIRTTSPTAGNISPNP